MLLAAIFLPLVTATVIPRELLFSNPKYSSISLSPNGRFVAYLAPDANKIKNVFMMCTSCWKKMVIPQQKPEWYHKVLCEQMAADGFAPTTFKQPSSFRAAGLSGAVGVFVTCEGCGQNYIGVTMRSLYSHLDEHVRALRNRQTMNKLKAGLEDYKSHVHEYSLSCLQSTQQDFRFVAYLAPDENKINNVFVMCTSCGHTRQVTFERNDDVLDYFWTGVDDVIIYAQDNNGDENTMLFKKNISEAEIAANPEKRTVISNRPGVKAIIMDNNLRGARILVGLNDENPVYHNVYSFDLKNDTMTLLMRNHRFGDIITDNALDIRLASEEQPDGSVMYFRLSSKADPRALTSDPKDWEEYLLVQPEDTAISSPKAFDKSNQNMFWIWGEDSDLGTLVTFPFDAIDQKEVLYTATRAQIGNTLLHPTDKTLLAVTEVYHKPELFVVNSTIADDIEYLQNLRPHGSLIISTSLDMTTWLVTYLSSDRPEEIFLYRRSVKTAEFLFNTRPELEKYKLNRQVGFDFKTRDDMVLQAYLSLPPEAALRSPQDVNAADRDFAELGLLPVEPQKLVVLVHGGPKVRDYYGYSADNAWLTNRGYAVLQVNYRGSTGFGKRLTNAGDGEWSRKMHYDILDSVEFAVAKGITTKAMVAIMGASYGGYETLVALTFTPDEFACGVDIVGPSNLITLLQTIPPYWRNTYKELVRSMGGDIDTEAGRQSLAARSPLFFADRVKKPLLIIQGANDPRVKRQESDQFVAALQKNNIPVSYILYPDEGHGCRKAKNLLAQSGFIEKFLHSCLGGRMEPFRLGQYNSSAILMSDGFAPPTRPTSLPINPLLVPQVFYRPMAPQPFGRPTVYLPPTAGVNSWLFPQN